MSTSSADAVTARLQPVEDAYPDPEGNLAALVAALMAPVQIVDEIVRDSDTQPAWQSIRDPDTAPDEFIPWLELHNGTVSPPSATMAERRDRIKNNPGFDDGKTGPLKAEVARTLTGVQAVEVLRRQDDVWSRMAVVTSTTETPDPDATLAAAMRAKPAAVLLELILSDVWLIGQMEASEWDTIGALETEFATIADLEAHTP
jgi:hypothetical protein